MRRRAGFAAILTLLVAAAPARAEPRWLQPFVLGFDVFDVAMAPDGTTVYAGVADDGGSFRAAVQVRPVGGPVGPVQFVSTAAASLPPDVAAGPDGRFVIAWAENGEVRTAVMPAGATSFGDALPMPEATGEIPVGLTAVAVDPSGAARVIWPTFKTVSGGSEARMRAAVRPPGGAPGPAQELENVFDSGSANTTFLELSVAVAADGAAIAAWSRFDSASGGDSASYVRAALARGGQPFDATVPLDSGELDSSQPQSAVNGPAVAITPGGRAAVTWYRNDQNGSDFDSRIRYREGTAAAGLGPVLEPSAPGGELPQFPSVAFPTDGRALVAFSAKVSGVDRPQVATRPPGASEFTSLETVTQSGDASGELRLASFAGGQVFLLFKTQGAAGGVSAAVAPPGAELGDPVPLASGLSSMNAFGLDVDAAGDAVGIWRHATSGTYETDAAGYDAAGPYLRDLQLPGSGVVGQELSFGVRPVDVWSPIASVAWDFGDGARAEGTSVLHTFAAPGDRAVGVTAVDGVGNATTGGGTVPVAPAPPLPPLPPPPGPGLGDRVAPVISAFDMTRTRFAVGGALTAVRRRAPRGTQFRIAVSEPGTARITVWRQRPGLRRVARGRCGAPTAAARRALVRAGGRARLRRARCTRLVAVPGSVSGAVALGRSTIAWNGRLAGRALKPGAYRARVRVVDAAGNPASRSGPTFRIVRR
jgi:PKD domain-containing protein